MGRLLALGLRYESSPIMRPDPFAWFWFFCWSLVGIVAIPRVCALLFARPEVVTFKDDEIIVSRYVGPWDRTSRWSIRKITGMRLRESYRGGEGTIRFEYEGRTRTLLPPSDRDSTLRMLDEINAKLAG